MNASARSSRNGHLLVLSHRKPEFSVEMSISLSLFDRISVGNATMKLILRTVLILLCGFCCGGLLIGCGGTASAPVDTGTEPPHEGTLVPLPDGKSWIEFVKKTGVAPITSELTVYFYRDGKYTPHDQMPDSAILAIDNKRKVTLKADDDALVTPPGPILFGDNDVRGELSFELEGLEMKIPLGFR